MAVVKVVVGRGGALHDPITSASPLPPSHEKASIYTKIKYNNYVVFNFSERTPSQV